MNHGQSGRPRLLVRFSIGLQSFLQSRGKSWLTFLGLDLSLLTVAVCVIGADDKHVSDHTVAREINGIARSIHDVPASEARIDCESGATS
jgi:hypothetical protein